MTKTVFDVLLDKLEAEKAIAASNLTLGRAKSFEEYREMCGVIRGLTIAEDEIDTLARAYNKDEDDE